LNYRNSSTVCPIEEIPTVSESREAARVYNAGGRGKQAGTERIFAGFSVFGAFFEVFGALLEVFGVLFVSMLRTTARKTSQPSRWVADLYCGVIFFNINCFKIFIIRLLFFIIIIIGGPV